MYHVYISTTLFLNGHRSREKKKNLESEKPQEKTAFKSPQTLFNPPSKHQNHLSLVSTSSSTVLLLQTAATTATTATYTS
jgi:hypothetical protein